MLYGNITKKNLVQLVVNLKLLVLGRVSSAEYKECMILLSSHEKGPQNGSFFKLFIIPGSAFSTDFEAPLIRFSELKFSSSGLLIATLDSTSSVFHLVPNASA
ncbi:LOW QUALITY PROTEIN: hypothetical protein TorRG33x02_100440 [Trema orientale]|uniref:Uncharacterized protein n=1 Tax=Trema orientale TaxID=63057 RepID=A0A2P5F879_TREOI|nr:LOW QUALITY PROTEIN: hypothetical protein TorRG33x02_100440 [Trema orientale]